MDSSIGIVLRVSDSGCDARRAVAAFLPLAVADAEWLLLILGEAATLELLVLSLELFFLLQLRITLGLMVGSGSRGTKSGEQWIKDMLIRVQSVEGGSSSSGIGGCGIRKGRIPRYVYEMVKADKLCLYRVHRERP